MPIYEKVKFFYTIIMCFQKQQSLKVLCLVRIVKHPNDWLQRFTLTCYVM